MTKKRAAANTNIRVRGHSFFLHFLDAGQISTERLESNVVLPDLAKATINKHMYVPISAQID